MIHKLDLPGRITNTQVPRSKPLLPLFEAVVNSFQAIEELGKDAGQRRIDIFVERLAILPEHGEAEIDGFRITDTGIGFTDTNFDAFLTSDTRNKASKGGKGVGRFSWLKVFEHAEIESHYRLNGHLAKRSFRFSAKDDAPPTIDESTETHPKTIVRLVGFKNAYKEHCPRGLETIGHRIIEHCLPYFLAPDCPKVIIADGNDSEDLNLHFKHAFAASATTHEVDVKGNRFTMRGLRLYHADEPHRLIFAANSREVSDENLERLLPNLQKRLKDDAGLFAYLGFVEGSYLDQNLNSERTAFTFPTEGRIDDVLSEVTLEDIRTAVVECVNRELKPYLDEINAAKRDAVLKYITNDAPEYRVLARDLASFIDKIPPGTGGRKLDTFLHEQIYERQRAIRKETAEIFDEGLKAALKAADYEARVKAYIEKANELGKSSLAQYVVHRKVMLEFLERSLEYDPGTNKHPNEDIIHKIIFPMRATSDEVSYEQQNLWIIDEKLSFYWYLASDQPLSSQPSPLESDSDDRPDLLAFDRALSYGEDEGILTSLVIVEFKKPMRKDYSKEDPIDQAYRLLHKIRAGHFKNEKGREIVVSGQDIPAYIYIICDRVTAIDEMAVSKTMHRTTDGQGYYVYNELIRAYVEIIPYANLLNTAKKRNRILFDKLHLPLHASSQTAGKL